MDSVKKNVDYKVKGYYGKWSVIDTFESYSLLEHNTYGDETCYLVVRTNNNVEELEYTNKDTEEKIILPTVIEVICETFDGIEIALEDEGIL